jgi:hypothetical protein
VPWHYHNNVHDTFYVLGGSIRIFLQKVVLTPGQAFVDCRGEVILWTDIGTHHVMKYRKNLQPFSAASGAHRLFPFNLHPGTPRDIRGVMFNKARRDGPACWRRGRKGRCSACERRP